MFVLEKELLLRILKLIEMHNSNEYEINIISEEIIGSGDLRIENNQSYFVVLLQGGFEVISKI